MALIFPDGMMIVQALDQSGRNILYAARALGLSEYGLAKAMKRLGIRARPE